MDPPSLQRRHRCACSGRSNTALGEMCRCGDVRKDSVARYPIPAKETDKECNTRSRLMILTEAHPRNDATSASKIEYNFKALTLPFFCPLCVNVQSSCTPKHITVLSVNQGSLYNEHGKASVIAFSSAINTLLILIPS